MALYVLLYGGFVLYLLAWVAGGYLVYRGVRYKNESSLTLGLMILSLCLVVTMGLAYLLYTGNQLREAGQ